jgi:hypothetical protein
MLTATSYFVMSSLSLEGVVRRGFGLPKTRFMQIAMSQNDIIANCNPQRGQ